MARVGRRGAQVEVGNLEVETARVTHLTSREGDPHGHVRLMLNTRVNAPDRTWGGLHSVSVRQHIAPQLGQDRPKTTAPHARPSPGHDIGEGKQLVLVSSLVIEVKHSAVASSPSAWIAP